MPESKKGKILIAVLLALDIVLSAAVGAMYLTIRNLEQSLSQQAEETIPQPSAPHQDVLNPIVGRTTLSATGDILLAQPILDACLAGEDTYDFEPLFRNLAPYVHKAGIASVNLVTTLAGDGTDYSGLPKYNSPDAIVSTLASTGFDAVLTANSHCYEAGLKGVVRTAETIRHAYMAPVGTTYDLTKPTWKILESDGIQIGMACYTVETDDSYPAMPSINGQLFDRESIPYVDTYNPDNLDAFLEEAGEKLQMMRQSGADVTIMFMHWGTEFSLNPSSEQLTLAQSLCDMGYDVILGTHPHVIQPVSELTSRVNPSHKSVVCYSLGNALSNQRKGYGKPLTTAHTEDGVLLTLSFAKYADGRVLTESVNALPYWVNLHSESDPATYTIIPLDENKLGGLKEEYGLSPENTALAMDSYDRTMAILSPGLDTVNVQLQTALYNRAFSAPTEPAPEIPEEEAVEETAEEAPVAKG